MVHAKNYETASTLMKLCRENCGIFFPGLGVDIAKGHTSQHIWEMTLH